MGQTPGWAEGVLAASLWSYATTVLYPARVLKRGGLALQTPPTGEPPEPAARRGLGPHFSLRHDRPVLLDEESPNQHLVDEFDRMAEVYEAFVQPFSQVIFDEALTALGPYLSPDARVLDLGCGPGVEAIRVARLVPEGEVVGVDLAAEMVGSASRATWAAGLDNCAFFQADVSDLPRAFTGKFDLAYSSLAHHHYPDPDAATRSILRCLRPGGIYAVVDPGPAWFNLLAAPLARLGDPGWVGFKAPKEFVGLFRAAGFARASWVELLPGFGLALGQAT